MKMNQRFPGTFFTRLLFFLFLLLIPLLFLAGKKWYTNYRFSAYTDQLFRQELKQNILNLHYTVADPASMGISDYTVSLGAFDLKQISLEYASLENRKAKLESFCYQDLTSDNRLTSDILLLAAETDLSSDNRYTLYEMLSPSLGIQAQLPILLAEYTFRSEQDIQDYLKLLSSITEYFQGILSFERMKSREGTFMSDTTADRVIQQCQAFIADPGSNYLDSVFREKLEQFSGLSSEKKEAYCRLHERLISECVIPSYQNLIEGLLELKGTGTNTGGLCGLPGGKAYYEYLLKSNCGLYDSVPQIQSRLLAQLQSDLTESSQLMAADPALIQQLSLNSESGADDSSPEEILQELQEKLQKDFPEAPDVSYQIKEIHPDLEEYLSPAFYLTPPIDTLSPNAIYLNGHSQLEGSELFTTLAHEGFPGHLYQTVTFARTKAPRIRYLMNMGGYVEGWATYIESYAYGYQDQEAALSRLQWLNRSVNLCIYSLLDTGIHYDGWTLEKASRFLSGLGITQPETAETIYQVIVEDPSNYLKYYMGYLQFLDLRNAQEEELGEDFDIREFHRKVLEIGPCQFPILESYLEQSA